MLVRIVNRENPLSQIKGTKFKEGKIQKSIQSSTTTDQDTTWKVTKTQSNIKHKRAKGIAISQHVTTRLQWTDKKSMTNTKQPTLYVYAKVYSRARGLMFCLSSFSCILSSRGSGESAQDCHSLWCLKSDTHEHLHVLTHIKFEVFILFIAYLVTW